MPDLRLTRLPGHVEYILDGAAEAGELPGGARTALMLYGDPATIVERLDWLAEPIDVQSRLAAFQRGERLPRTYNDRRFKVLDVAGYGMEIVASLDPLRRNACHCMSVAGFVNTIAEHATWLAASNFEDQTKGGCMQPFLDRWLLTRDAMPTPKVRRRLNSLSAIRRYVRREAELDWLRSVYGLIVRSATDPLDPTIYREGVDLLIADERRQIDADVARARQDLALMAEAEAYDLAGRIMPTPRHRKVRRRRRSIIKRSVATAVAIVGSEAVSRFAQGQAVAIRGQEVTFEVKCRASLADLRGHGTLAISLHSHDGDRLGGLCLYQENVPPLDQLTSIALHVQAGEEHALLDVGNLFNVTAAAVDHPAIVARRARRPEMPRQLMAVNGRLDDRAAFDANRAAYEARMGPAYREVIETFVFGPKLHWPRRIAEAA